MMPSVVKNKFKELTAERGRLITCRSLLPPQTHNNGKGIKRYCSTKTKTAGGRKPRTRDSPEALEESAQRSTSDLHTEERVSQIPTGERTEEKPPQLGPVLPCPGGAWYPEPGDPVVGLRPARSGSMYTEVHAAPVGTESPPGGTAARSYPKRETGGHFPPLQSSMKEVWDPEVPGRVDSKSGTKTREFILKHCS